MTKEAEQLEGAVGRWDNEGGAPRSGHHSGEWKMITCVNRVVLFDEDNKSNNQATARCQLAEGHAGIHRRSFTKLGKHGKRGEVIIEWDGNIADS